MVSSPRIPCPHCGVHVKASVLPEPGAKVQCPKCHGKFRFTPTSPPENWKIRTTSDEDELKLAPLTLAPAATPIAPASLPIASLATPSPLRPSPSKAADVAPQRVAPLRVKSSPLVPFLFFGVVTVLLGIGAAFVLGPKLSKLAFNSFPKFDNKPVSQAATNAPANTAPTTTTNAPPNNAANALPESTSPPISPVATSSTDTETKTYQLNSPVRQVRWANGEKAIAVSLNPNEVNSRDPPLEADRKQAAAAIFALEKKLEQEKKQFELDRELARDALALQIERDKSLSIEEKHQKTKSETPKFDEETKSLLKEKFILPVENEFERQYARLRKAHGAASPGSEVAAYWRLNALAPDVVLAQPDFKDSEQPQYRGARDRDKMLLSLLSPTRYYSASDWRQTPPALIASDRLIWFNRLKGAMEWTPSTKTETSLGLPPEMEIRFALLSPNGEQLLIKGMRKARPDETDETRMHLDGNRVRYVYESGILDLKTKKFNLFTDNHPYYDSVEACFTSDSRRLIAKATPKKLDTSEAAPKQMYAICQFDVSTLSEVGAPILFPLQVGTESIGPFDVSPNGERLAMLRGLYRTEFHLFDLTSSQNLLSGLQEFVESLIFSPDSRTIAAFGGEARYRDHDEVLLIDAETGKLRRKLTEKNNKVSLVGFSPNSRILVVVAANRLRLYDAETLSLLGMIEGQTGALASFVFSTDGSRLAIVLGKTVEIWNVPALIKQDFAKSELFAKAAPTVASTSKPRPKPSTNSEPGKAAAGTAPGKSAPSTNSIGMKFVTVPPGEFQMGSPDDEKIDPTSTERPQHKVKLTKPITIGAYEVTIGQYRRFVESTTLNESGDGGPGASGYDAETHVVFEENRPKFNWSNTGFTQPDDAPVVNVSWTSAQLFCKWLSGREGKVVYRLPTEAEWEYCCRAGAATRFPTGEDEESLKGFGNFGDEALKENWPDAKSIAAIHDGAPFTSPVGKFKPNAFGIYDMLGNVSEWCEDRYDPEFYMFSPETDPTGPYISPFQNPSEREDPSNDPNGVAITSRPRVVRGGSWLDDFAGQRPARRLPGRNPNTRSVSTGFRVVRIEAP